MVARHLGLEYEADVRPKGRLSAPLQALRSVTDERRQRPHQNKPNLSQTGCLFVYFELNPTSITLQLHLLLQVARFAASEVGFAVSAVEAQFV